MEASSIRIGFPRPRPPVWLREDLGSATGAGVRVAVVDSGWNRRIPEDRIEAGLGLVDDGDPAAFSLTEDDDDRIGHGTACADLILRLAPGVRIVPLRVFGTRLETSIEPLIAAVDWAAEQGIRLVNLSLGTQRTDLAARFYHACERARRRGTLIVASGHIASAISFPAVFDCVIGVGAGHFTHPFQYRYRPEQALECEAKGFRQPVLTLTGKTVLVDSTSFAAPNITGIVALLLEQFPGADLREIRSLLARYAEPSTPLRAPPADAQK